MSLINNIAPQHVEFVSYTGKYPNLCSGTLILKIDGEEHRFGYNSGQHERFWISGGECYFTGGYSEAHVSEDSWVIDVSRLPENLKPYAAEIDKVFNSNVEHGCCGGCV